MIDFHPHSLAPSAKIVRVAIFTMVTSAEKSGYLDLPADWLSEYAIAPTMSSAVNDKIPLIPQLLSQDHQNFILSPYQVIARLFARQWLPDDDRFCR